MSRLGRRQLTLCGDEDGNRIYMRTIVAPLTALSSGLRS